MITLLWIIVSLALYLASSIGLGWLPAKQWLRTDVQRIIAALTLSIPIWTLQAYSAGYAQVRFMGGVVALIGLIVALTHVKEITHAAFAVVLLIRRYRILTAFALISLAIQLLGVVGSGIPHTDGARVFHRLQSSDGLMHAAFAQSMVREFPPLQPGAVGMPITNYHYWSNLYIAEISRLFNVPVDVLLFQVIPVLLGLLLVAHLVLLGQAIRVSITSLGWMLFFHFWAGNSLTFLSKIFKNTWDFTLPAIDHGMIQFYNPPQTFAKMLLFFFAWWWITSLRRKRPSFYELFALLSLPAFMFGYKVYFGLYAYCFVMLWAVVSYGREALTKRLVIKDFLIFMLATALSLVLAFCIYTPPNKQAGGLFWAPLAWPKILLGQQYLNWNEWWLRMQVYEEAGSWKGLGAIYLSASLICLIGIGGTRLIGLISLPHVLTSQVTKNWWMTNFIASLAFFFVVMNFLQISGGANTFNFFILSLIVWGWFSGIIMGEVVSHWSKKKYVIVALIIILTSVPRPLQEVWLWYKSYTQAEGSFVLQASEFEALSALRTMPEGVFVSSPHDTQDFYETPYRSFFANKPSFLSGLGILKSHNQSIADREAYVKLLFNQQDWQSFRDMLASKDITYVFLSTQALQQLRFASSPELASETVYANADFKVIKALE